MAKINGRLAERVAVLETELHHLWQRGEAQSKATEHLAEEIKAVANQVRAIRDGLRQYGTNALILGLAATLHLTGGRAATQFAELLLSLWRTSTGL